MALLSADPELRELAALLVDPSAQERVRDWKPVVRRAVRERVAPLLHRKLPQDASIPDDLRFTLKRELYRCGALNQLLYDELRRLLRSAAECGLPPPVVLKGGALATSVYEEIALRPMSDLDLLVEPRHLPAWIACARELGMEAPAPEMSPGLRERVHYQHALANERATIELHVGLVGGPTDWRSPEPGWFAERTEPWRAPPGSREAGALQLSATAHLLYASAHLMLQHGAARSPLLWLFDAHVLLSRRAESIDWSELTEAAQEMRWGVAVSETLSLSRSLLGTAIPGEAQETMRPTDPERRHVRRKSDPALSRAEHVWREMGCVSTRDRLRWCLAILFPSPFYMKWRYSRAGWLWPLGYPYRWAVVVREAATLLVTAVRTKSRAA